MKVVTLDQATSRLSDLITEAKAGEDVIIQRGRQVVVHIVATDGACPKRQFGALIGKITVTPAFSDPLPGRELSAWDR
jgi:antitoxin (DNA-binding transcriptional repressor) of toxin-antitoxin stability system